MKEKDLKTSTDFPTFSFALFAIYNKPAFSSLAQFNLIPMAIIMPIFIEKRSKFFLVEIYWISMCFLHNQ